jgi:tetratricopeptide (TPR) repeat protein
LNKGWTPEYLTQARASFERSQALDPKNIDAMVGLALVDLIVGATYLSDDRAPFLAKAEAALINVLSLAPNHAFAHMAFGALLITTKRTAEGMAECERALALDRNLAEAHVQIGIANYSLGRGAETEAHVNEALRLSPRDVFAHRWFLTIGIAKLQLNEDAEALGWMLRSVEANRNYPIAHFFLAATLALLGSPDRARAAAKAGLVINPSFTVTRFREAAFSDDPSYLAFRERLYEGMRLAGVPEA